MAVKKYKNVQFRPRPSALATYGVQNNEWVDTRILSDQKTAAKEEIDVTAELKRREYITSQPGQVAVYNEKYLDAKAYADAGYPALSGSPSDYPFVRAEAAAMNATNQEAADLIIATREMWVGIAAQIEEARRRGKINVGESLTTEEVTSAKNSALDALNQI